MWAVVRVKVPVATSLDAVESDGKIIERAFYVELERLDSFQLEPMMLHPQQKQLIAEQTNVKLINNCKDHLSRSGEGRGLCDSLVHMMWHLAMASITSNGRE